MPVSSDAIDAAQLPLPFPEGPDSLRKYLSEVTGRNISLAVTNNSTSMISVKTKGIDIYVRMHRIFLAAGPDVISEIAGFVINRKGKTPLVRRFISQNSGFLRKTSLRRSTIRTGGKYFDLACVFQSVNDEYFGGRIAASITWGTRNRRRFRSERTLGSYSLHTNTIRISPSLDKKTIPDYFLEFIVYHEMLHADVRSNIIKGRRSIHSPEFRMREKLFKKYEKAMYWEKNR